MFDQVVANLRGLREAIQCSAGVLHAQTVQSWTDKIDTAIADLLEIERRARYAEVLAVGAALVDVTIEGPPAADSRQAQPGLDTARPADPSRGAMSHSAALSVLLLDAEGVTCSDGH
jgi:hypothetical protein